MKLSNLKLLEQINFKLLCIKVIHIETSINKLFFVTKESFF